MSARETAVRPSSSRGWAAPASRVPAGRELRAEASAKAWDPVAETVHQEGRPLESGVRTDMESRFGRDFSRVRVHVDATADRAARSLQAAAYAIGPHLGFAAGRYAPNTETGRRLLAHELTHVAQTRAEPMSNAAGWDVEASSSSLEQEARHVGAWIGAGGRLAAGYALGAPAASPTPRVYRADPDAVGYTMRLGQVGRTGLQFIPTNVTDTKVGPVSPSGPKLNVVVGENITLRRLGVQLLPLWTTATPFTPPGAASPLPLAAIDAEQLARALVVYNQTYLPIPAMTQWRAGLRLPLPVDVDEVTGIATLHPAQIQSLATAFDPTWAPLLDARAGGLRVAPAATLRADVTAFLANVTTPLDRGAQLAARSLVNAQAEVAFVREAFRQLGAADFDVALAFMNTLVNHEVAVLAAQRDGDAIINEVWGPLMFPPANLTTQQQTDLDRANVMLRASLRVTTQDPPTAVRTLPEKTITVDTLKLDGSSRNPAADVAVADAIYSQCNVRVRQGVDATATPAQTSAWLRGNLDLRSDNNCGNPSVEERNLFLTARTTFGFGARFSAFYVASISGLNGSGYSCIASDSPHALMRNRLVVSNSGDSGTLAHELAHILRDSGSHPNNTIAGGRPAGAAQRQPRFVDAQCAAIYRNA